jgi:D-inositol-3-phosphate glycosyltransferase
MERRDLFVIPNGVDTRSFRPLKKKSKFDLLFVGRFQKAKGLDILLDALAILHKGGREVPKLGVIGWFGQNQIRKLTSGLDAAVRGVVEFIGAVTRDQMPELINSTRFVVLPSRYESFGLVALEAISCGVPVIATRVGGLPELVEHPVGILVDSANPRKLAKTIEVCGRDGTLIGEALAAGPRKASGYDWTLVAERMMRVLDLGPV